MKFKSVGLLMLMYLLVSFVVSFFVIFLLATLVVGALNNYRYGNNIFEFKDIVNALKASLCSSIPVAVGVWILAKINERKINKDKASKLEGKTK
jgi:hypothetical protein